MKLVGATDWFIRIPFMLEGLIQGFIGGVAACGGLWLINNRWTAGVERLPAEQRLRRARRRRRLRRLGDADHRRHRHGRRRHRLRHRRLPLPRRLSCSHSLAAPSIWARSVPERRLGVDASRIPADPRPDAGPSVVVAAAVAAVVLVGRRRRRTPSSSSPPSPPAGAASSSPSSSPPSIVAVVAVASIVVTCHARRAGRGGVVVIHVTGVQLPVVEGADEALTVAAVTGTVVVTVVVAVVGTVAATPVVAVVVVGTGGRHAR